MSQHPAYPTRSDLQRHGAALRLAEAAHANNAAVLAILDRALADLNALDLHGYSMVPGYDLRDIVDTIQDMRPVLDNDAGEALDRWAHEQVETGMADATESLAELLDQHDQAEEPGYRAAVAGLIGAELRAVGAGA